MNIEVKRICSEDKDFFLEKSIIFYNSSAVIHSVDESCHVNTFNEIIARDTYLLGYILCLDNKKIGYVLLSKMYDTEAGDMTIWIEELYVDPEYRSRGIGKFFFSWLEENHPASLYRLEATAVNTRAINLYKSLGYKPSEYLQFYKDN